MTERTLAAGDAVSTSTGERGRIVKRSANAFTVPGEYERYDLEGVGDLLVYTVLLENGEVRKYSFEALVV